MTKQIFSGAMARKWRRELASSAERCDPTMRTLKFPLEVDSLPTWPDVKGLARATSSDEVGSLIYVLYTLLLNGWRIFGKQAQAVSFANQRVMDDRSWIDSVIESSGLAVAKDSFIPSRIYQRILIAPRATGAKDTGFKPETVAAEYAKFFCGGKHGEKIPDIERDLFARIGDAMCMRFDSWKALVSDPAAAGGVIDQVVSGLGWKSPKVSLSARIAAISPPAVESTIGYDPEAPAYRKCGDVAINLIVSRALKSGRDEGLSEKKDLVRYAQEFMTGDPNHGGLAWPFGRRGIEYFSKTSPAQIAEDFGLPSEEPATLVAEAYKALPPVEASFLGDKTYANYRSSIGGTLGSWIANYIARLDELHQALSAQIEPISLPQALLDDHHLFEEIGATPGEITSMANRAATERDVAREALNRLYGIAAQRAGVSDVADLERYSTLVFTLSGILSSLKEGVSRALSAAESRGDKDAAEILKGYAFDTPEWVAPLQKINRLNLSQADPEAVLNEAARRYELLHDAMHIHYARILKWSAKTGETLSPLTRIAAREEAYAQSGKSCNPAEQAYRNCIDIVGRAARKCTEPTLRRVADFYRAQAVFADESDCNKFFFNRQGFLYKSTFNSNPRQPFAIHRDSVKRAQGFLDDLDSFMRSLREDVLSGDTLDLALVTDLYRLERAHFAMRLNGFPDSIPSNLALIPEVDEVFNLPDMVLLRVGENTVSSSTMRKIFNHYYIELESLVAILLRPGFYLRAKFSRAGDNVLIYVPEGEAWNAPERLYETAKPIGAIMRRLEKAAGGRLPVDPVTALPFLAQTSESMDGTDIRAYMRQAPHAWYYPWPAGKTVQGLPSSKNGMGKKTVTATGSRLIGPPSYKGVLDTALTCPDSVSLSDASIIFDQTFSQKATRKPDGKIELSISESGGEMYLALPVKEMPVQKSASRFENLVAIDLGERGLAYSVFNPETRELIDKGRVKIKSMHRLVMDDRAGRRKTSEANKFRAKFDRAEERRRDNVAGDFCTAINRLMWYYKAFPVLEYSPGGASNGIDRVYKSVTERYLPTQTPTVDAERRGYWAGASFWRHPTLLQAKFNKQTGKRAGTPEPLTLFPGAGVSEYGTSQECSCCGRNPIDSLIAIRKSGVKRIVVEEGGAVRLENGTILLRVAGGAAKDRRSGRAPLAAEVKSGEHRIDEVISLARRNLRRAPDSRQAQDTMQSRYQCLYEDCSKTQHADENAATNIARKFMTGRLVGLTYEIQSG